MAKELNIYGFLYSVSHWMMLDALFLSLFLSEFSLISADGPCNRQHFICADVKFENDSQKVKCIVSNLIRQYCSRIWLELENSLKIYISLALKQIHTEHYSTNKDTSGLVLMIPFQH